MYPPKHHIEGNENTIKKVVKTYPFATLVSAKDSKPFITHAPLILDDNTLVGHIDKNNPHTQVLCNNHPIVAIFHGPQTYISPSIYTTQQLPTWNYIIAHAHGFVNTIEDPNLIKQSIVNMTNYLEAPDHKYILGLDDPKMDRLINYVHGFQIKIDHWEGKFKLSQDKIPADIHAAKQILIKNNQTNIENFVNDLFEAHF